MSRAQAPRRARGGYGIIVQSASGGGIIKTLANNFDNVGGPTNGAWAAHSKEFAIDLNFGNIGNNTSRFSGAALVTTTDGGTIVTSGDNGIGILAQSVAGGDGPRLDGEGYG